MLLKISKFIERVSEYLKFSYNYSSLQFNLPEKIAEKIRMWGLINIPEKDLIGAGREKNIHLTLKYGLHNHDPFEFRDIISKTNPIKVRLKKISVFENMDANVVKIDVQSPELIELNKKISDNFKHTNTYLDYIPHITIAYVKPGQEKEYIGCNNFENIEIIFNSVIFSGNDNRVTTLNFKE